MRHLTMGTALLMLAAAGVAQAPEPAPPAAAAKESDPIICKQQPTTGSRIGSQRICMTRSQWDIQRRELDEARRLQGEIRPNAPR
jgi:hypothetical protein